MGFFHGNYYGNIMGAPILKENNKSIHGQDQGTRCFTHSLVSKVPAEVSHNCRDFRVALKRSCLNES
jgi:hypothetical protein